MSTLPPTYLSAEQLLQQLHDKKITSLELTEQAITRIEQLDTVINAVVVKDYDRARQAARDADKAIARGEQKSLLGLPLTVKESFNVTGLPTSWGNKHFKDWTPSEDALVISRLKSAGAIILGKTNVPFMLGDWQTYNDIYGTTHNPWDIKRTPGGSSGGSAAALAMGYVSLELGSDLAGSLRAPAHFCGVFAHRPTYHLVPLRGAGPPKTPITSEPKDFVVAGPMARTAGDLKLMLEVIAGPDELAEGGGYKLELPASRCKHLNDFRVLLLDEHPLYPTDSAIIEIQNHLYEQLAQAGVNISRAHSHLPDLGEITRTYAFLLGAWFSDVMTPEGYQATCNKSKKLPEEAQDLSSQFLRGLTATHRDWLAANRRRQHLQQLWSRLYQSFDIILAPVMPTPAFLHDQSADPEKRRFTIAGLEVPYSHQYIWVSMATLFGLPVTTMPIGFIQNSLPVGIQIIGNYLHDQTTLCFASLLENLRGGFTPPPLGM